MSRPVLKLKMPARGEPFVPHEHTDDEVIAHIEPPLRVAPTVTTLTATALPTQTAIDARLLAAAEDLLEAAEAAMKRLNALTFEGKNMPDDDDAGLKLEAAIAKAKGGVA